MQRNLFAFACLVLIATVSISTAGQGSTQTWDYTQFGSIQNRHDLETARELLRSGKCRHVYLDLGTNVGVQIRKL